MGSVHFLATFKSCYKMYLCLIFFCTFSSSVGWLAVLRIYVAFAIFHPYRDLEAGDNQSLKSLRQDWESNPLLPLSSVTDNASMSLMYLNKCKLIHYMNQ